jgi:hypothetical protein
MPNIPLGSKTMKGMKIIILLMLSAMSIYAESILEYCYYTRDFSIKFTIDKSGEIIIQKIFSDNYPWHIETKSQKLLDFELFVIQRDIDQIPTGILEISETNTNFVDYLEDLNISTKTGKYIVKLVHVKNNSEKGVTARNNSAASNRLLNWIYEQIRQEIEGNV